MANCGSPKADFRVRILVPPPTPFGYGGQARQQPVFYGRLLFLLSGSLKVGGYFLPNSLN